LGGRRVRSQPVCRRAKAVACRLRSVSSPPRVPHGSADVRWRSGTRLMLVEADTRLVVLLLIHTSSQHQTRKPRRRVFWLVITRCIAGGCRAGVGLVQKLAPLSRVLSRRVLCWERKQRRSARAGGGAYARRRPLPCTVSLERLSHRLPGGLSHGQAQPTAAATWLTLRVGPAGLARRAPARRP